MRILQIVGEIDGGGVGAVVFNYLSHMNLSDINCDILAFEKDRIKKQQLDTSLKSLGIKVIYLKHRNKGYIPHFKQINEIFRKNKYDIVHCHFGIWSTPYLMIAKWHGVKVRIAHSHIAKDEYGKKKQIILNATKPLLNYVTTHRFACGIEAGKYLWGKHKFIILNNAIDVDKYKFDLSIRNKKREELGISCSELVIGHVGRFCYQKNQDFIIELAKDLSKCHINFKMLLVGTGEDFEKIVHKVKQINLIDKVILLGIRDDVNELMQAMDLFVLPSRYEGLPVVAVEAQCAGLPTIISDCVTKEVLLSDSSYQLNIDNVAGWTELILKLTTLNAARRKRAREVIRQSGYDIKQESDKLKDMYYDFL